MRFACRPILSFTLGEAALLNGEVRLVHAAAAAAARGPGGYSSCPVASYPSGCTGGVQRGALLLPFPLFLLLLLVLLPTPAILVSLPSG